MDIIFSIPLLHWEKFPAAYPFLEETINNLIGDEQAKRKKLLTYVKKNWIPNAEIVSVRNAEARTNNFVESANRYLRRKFGVRSSLWRVIRAYTFEDDNFIIFMQNT